MNAIAIERVPLWTDRRRERGPFDIIGDVHGCYDELLQLLETLGYQVNRAGDAIAVEPPPGRKAIFLGDLVDRGPESVAVLRVVMGMVEAGAAICLPGNHDDKLARKLKGRSVQVERILRESRL